MQSRRSLKPKTVTWGKSNWQLTQPWTLWQNFIPRLRLRIYLILPQVTNSLITRNKPRQSPGRASRLSSRPQRKPSMVYSLEVRSILNWVNTIKQLRTSIALFPWALSLSNFRLHTFGWAKLARHKARTTKPGSTGKLRWTRRLTGITAFGQLSYLRTERRSRSQRDTIWQLTCLICASPQESG